MMHSIKSLLAALVVSLSLVAPVLAGPFEEGDAAYNRGDYATALRLWLPLAEEGQVNSQYNVGLIYAKGEGVPQDYAEAVKWYRKAAGQGDADAQFNLGIIYDQGKGVPQDYEKAVGWYRKAADQEDATAQIVLVGIRKGFQDLGLLDLQRLRLRRFIICPIVFGFF